MSDCGICGAATNYQLSAQTYYNDVLCLTCALVFFKAIGYDKVSFGSIVNGSVPFTSGSLIGIEVAKYRANPQNDCCVQCGRRHQ